MSEVLRQREAELRVAARADHERGDLAGAESKFEECLQVARQLEDPELADLAICNRASIRVALGTGDDEVAGLRSILLSSGSDTNAFLASYTVSRHYELKKEYKKSLFYARIALDRVGRLGNGSWLSGVRNQIGNALLATNVVPEAVASYEQALDAVEAGSLWSGTLLINLGYCDILQGRLETGLRRLASALRIARRHGSRLDEAQARLDLSFGYLERGSVARARRHAERALTIAGECIWPEGIKNALYLAGESARLDGAVDEAEQHFARLQVDYYPEQPYLRSLLMAVDVRRMLNLHA